MTNSTATTTTDRTFFPLRAFLLTLLGNVFVLVLLVLALTIVLVSAIIVFGGDVLGLTS